MFHRYKSIGSTSRVADYERMMFRDGTWHKRWHHPGVPHAPREPSIGVYR